MVAAGAFLADVSIGVPVCGLMLTAIVGFLNWERAKQERLQADFNAALARLRTAWSRLENISSVSEYSHRLLRHALDVANEASVAPGPRCNECHSDSKELDFSLYSKVRKIEDELAKVVPIPQLCDVSDVDAWNRQQYRQIGGKIESLYALWDAYEENLDEHSSMRLIRAKVRRDLRSEMVQAFDKWYEAQQNLLAIAGHEPAIRSLLKEAEVYVRYWWTYATCGADYGADRTRAYHAAQKAMNNLNYCFVGAVGTSKSIRYLRSRGA